MDDQETTDDSGFGESENDLLREQVRELNEEVSVLLRRLQDAPKRVRTLE